MAKYAQLENGNLIDITPEYEEQADWLSVGDTWMTQWGPKQVIRIFWHSSPDEPVDPPYCCE